MSRLTVCRRRRSAAGNPFQKIINILLCNSMKSVEKKVSIIVIFLLVLLLGYYFRGQKNGSISNILNINSIKSGEKIPVVIVPHFEFATDKRNELLKNIGSKYKPKHAVIVSVNHFNSGDYDILLADKDWNISQGKLTGDKNIAQKIADNSDGEINNSAFENEHGIKNLLEPVHSNIATSVVPVIIKDTAKKEEIDKLISAISNNCSDCLIIASVDFSHYCPRAIAHVHDQYSIQALSTLDYEKTWLAETDSPQTLYLAEKIAKESNAENFHLFYNGNSGDPGEDDSIEVTSVVMGYYSDKKSDHEIEPATTFVIAGDVMFDRNVWHNYKGQGLKKIFDNFGTRPFRGTDLALLNLEGPISAKEIDDDWQSGSMVFNFPPETTETLKYINVNAVSLANNHTANAGSSGLSNTKKVLDAAGIQYFGSPEGFSADKDILRIDGPVPLSVIGIMTLSEFDQEALNSAIKSEKKLNRTVIVFPHWGEEYKEKHVAYQKNIAKEWIVAGADVIIGSHPHVVEDFEIVKPFDSAQGKPVVYSLGNFIFDQFFSTETQRGLVIAGTITKDKITLSFLPTKENVVKPEFLRGESKTNILSNIFDIDKETGFKKISSDTIEVAR